MSDIQIEQIRFELTWRIRHQTMYPDLPFANIKLNNDIDGIHFGLYAQDELTSVTSLFEIDHVYQFRKFATLCSAQGNGYGTKLLEYVISYIKKNQGKKLWCNSCLSSVSFYKRFGFIETNEYFTGNELAFVKMELKITCED